MADLLIRLSGVPEQILADLIQQGYFKTKSEAVRAGLLELGRGFNLLNQEMLQNIELQQSKTPSKPEPKLSYYH